MSLFPHSFSLVFFLSPFFFSGLAHFSSVFLNLSTLRLSTTSLAPWGSADPRRLTNVCVCACVRVFARVRVWACVCARCLSLTTSWIFNLTLVLSQLSSATAKHEPITINRKGFVVTFALRVIPPPPLQPLTLSPLPLILPPFCPSSGTLNPHRPLFHSSLLPPAPISLHAWLSFSF